jgi:DNA-binding NarL/FixJ family response regulator
MPASTRAPAHTRTLRIVTPHDIVTLGLRTMLDELLESEDSGLRLLTDDSDEAPDVMLYDVVALVEGDVGELDEWVSRPGTTVLALTRPLRPDLGALALDRGAATAIPLADSAEEMRAALLDALDETQDTSPPPHHGTEHDHEVGLSPRENDVMRGIVAGLSNLEIAAELYLSINSVKTYIRSAYRKIGVSTRSQAVAWSLRRGFAPGASTVGSRDAHDRVQGLN